ncbi:helix-turn-helix domain-containing protein [Bacillus paralicheniformis]|uniref:helix-turn-helix domain-containing protein n=1 Tax=Bacillus paralicheniformis TaxID=1648923 RepID=UPI0034D2C302
MGNQLGLKLKKIRKKRMLTLRDIEEQLGITHSYLSKVEWGVTNPSLKTLEKLALFFKVDKSYFFEGEKEDVHLESITENYDLKFQGVKVSEKELYLLMEVLRAFRKNADK